MGRKSPDRARAAREVKKISDKPNRSPPLGLEFTVQEPGRKGKIKMQPEMPIELYVHPTKGDDTYPGNSLYPFKTLTRALQQATPGTLIQLSRGAYSEATGERFPLVVIDGVALTGNLPGQGGGVVIEGGGHYRSLSFGDQTVAIVLLGAAELRGVTVSNLAAKGTGVWIETGSPTIAGCTLSRCGREGMLVSGTANPLISNCVFQENRAGLTLVRQSRGEIRNSLWRQNQFGIAISDQAAPLIISNQVMENRSGMVLSGAAAPIVRGNIFAQNQDVGLAVFGQAQPDLGQKNDPAGNRFRDNRLDLRHAGTGSLRLSGNQLDPTHTQGPIELLSTRSPVMLPSTPVPPIAPIVDAANTAPTVLPSQVGSPRLDESHSASGSLGSDQASNTNPDLRAAALITDPTAIRIHALIDRGYIPAAVSQKAETATIPIGEWLQWLQRAELTNADQTEIKLAHPDWPLTHLQAITSLVAALSLPAGHLHQLADYSDYIQIPNAQLQQVATALRHQLLAIPPANLGRDRLNLQVPLSPSQAAQLFYQSLVLLGKMPSLATLPDAAMPPAHGQPQRRMRLPPMAMGADRPIIVILDPGHGGTDTGVITRAEVAETLSGSSTMAPDQLLTSPALSGPSDWSEAMSMDDPAAGSPLMSGSASAPSSLRLPPEAPPPGMPEMRMPGEPPTLPNLTEKTIVLSIGQAIAGFLQPQGIQVVLTRSTDEQNPSASERLALITQHSATVWVSLHANASIARQSKINGLETYHNPDDRESMRLAWAIHKTLTRSPDLADRGVHPATFYLLRAAAIPAIHLEVGYITGDKDSISLANLAYHRYLSRSIANGILRYVRQKS